MPLLGELQSPASRAPARPVRIRASLFAAAVLLGPAFLFWHVHWFWNPDGDYAYGWVVPLLAAYLLKSRWDDRPAFSTPLQLAAAFALLFSLLTLPALWLQEAAPERNICPWAYAAAAIGTSLALIAFAGGAAWLRWFAFPCAFLFTAVPWPHGAELFIANSLTHRTAAATAEILCLVGVPSVQAGNLVHIETGVIDIDEACSGIRSLQAMVMISLFLGELFRLKPSRRFLLVFFGLAIALLANVLRTVILSVIGFHGGMAAVDRAHDAASFAALLFCLAATLVVAFALRPAKVTSPVRAAAIPALPVTLSLFLVAWFIAGEVAVETWYRTHEHPWPGWSWSLLWPDHERNFHFVQIPPRSLRLLICDQSQAAAWIDPDGSNWSLYWIRWNPGNLAAEAGKVHRPDVCLAAEGATLERDLGVFTFPAGDLQVPMHGYTFRLGGKTFDVFFALCEEGPGLAEPAWNSRFEQTGMLQRALEGRRRVGQQTLEFDIAGYSDPRDAAAVLAVRLGGMLGNH